MRSDSDPSPISPRTTMQPTQRAAGHRATSSADVQLDTDLEAALAAAVVRADLAVDSEPDADVSDAEVGTYRSSVREFVALCRREQIPPERVIVELKGALQASLRKQGKGAQELRMRQVLIATFLDAYYASDGRP